MRHNVARRAGAFWPWVVGIGVLVLVVVSLLFLLRAEEDEQAGAVGEPALAGPREPPPDARPPAFAPPAGGAAAEPIAAYRAATDNLTPAAASDPATLEPLLQRLAAAIDVVGEAAPERAAALRARVDSTRHGDWRVPRQTLLVKDAFGDAASVLAAAAERGIGGVDPTAAREVGIAAGHLTADRPLGAQGAEIVAFLQRVTRAFEGLR